MVIDFISWRGTTQRLEVPFRSRRDRKRGDVALSLSPYCDVPLELTILIDQDGVIHDWIAKWTALNTSSYWCFTDVTPPEPTEAQRAAIARLYLRIERPFAMSDAHSPNHSIMQWSFKGLTPQQISDQYGTGDRVFLAGRS